MSDIKERRDELVRLVIATDNRPKQYAEDIVSGWIDKGEPIHQSWIAGEHGVDIARLVYHIRKTAT